MSLGIAERQDVFLPLIQAAARASLSAYELRKLIAAGCVRSMVRPGTKKAVYSLADAIRATNLPAESLASAG